MGIVQTDEEQSCIQDGTGKADTYKADAEEDGTGRGSEGHGQSNFELNSHARLACYTMNKTGVASGSFS